MYPSRLAPIYPERGGAQGVSMIRAANTPPLESSPVNLTTGVVDVDRTTLIHHQDNTFLLFTCYALVCSLPNGSTLSTLTIIIDADQAIAHAITNIFPPESTGNCSPIVCLAHKQGCGGMGKEALPWHH
jgi:hypothetical protein